jgi:hypothetical protein
MDVIAVKRSACVGVLFSTIKKVEYVDFWPAGTYKSKSTRYQSNMVMFLLHIKEKENKKRKRKYALKERQNY